MPWRNQELYGLLPITEVDPQIVGRFTCGKENLDLFLQSCADAHNARISYTTAVFHADFEGIVGFFTLSDDSLKLKTSEIDAYGLFDYSDLASFPAVKIGRLAIAEELHGQGLGRQILRFIKASILESSYASACRLLIVDAVNEPAILNFYASHGFEDSILANDQSKNHGGKKIRGAKP